MSITFESFTKRIGEILESKMYFKREENTDYFSYEIYVDYRDKELQPETIEKLLDHNNPMEAYEDMLNEWAFDYECEYGYPEMTKELRRNLTDEEEEFWDEHYDEVQEWLQEHVYWYYDAKDFNSEVQVNIMLDTGDGNYDFTKNNILNWYGTSGGYGHNGEIEDESSILWLAKQQKKATALRKRCKEYIKGCRYENGEYVGSKATDDKFVESVVQELENIASHMSTLTFLVEMDLFELFELHKAIKHEEPLAHKYDPRQSKGTGYIVISKNTMCGLFDPWQGGGSVLEIELDKDVVLPIKYIWKANVEKRGGSWNYGIDEVYGMCGSAWRQGGIKEIRPMKEETNEVA